MNGRPHWVTYKTVLNVRSFCDCHARYSSSVSRRGQSELELDNGVSLAAADSTSYLGRMLEVQAEAAWWFRGLGPFGVFVCFYWKLKC